MEKVKKAKVFSIQYGKRKGAVKKRIEKAVLLENFGLEGDVRGGPGPKQVSLLAIESIKRQAGCPKSKNKSASLGAGDLSENITTEGLDPARLKIGDRLKLGAAVLEISKIGKECHNYCALYQKIGDCIIPREGIFAKVLKGGNIAVGDSIDELR